jgi:carbonic anhydrase
MLNVSPRGARKPGWLSRWIVPVLAASVFAAAPAACRKEASTPPPPESKAAPAEEKHWAYEDGPAEASPAHWGELAGDQACSTGQRQSPIAIATSGEGAAAAAAEPQDAFTYKPSKISVVNNGHTVQETYESGSSLSEGGVAYSLAQFHFHSPSEHTVDGQSFPIEIHLVHTDAAGKPALVVGILVKEGQENAALATVFANLPKEKGDKSEPAGATVDAAALLPADRSHFAYDGSLTTPPCTEGIRWRVMRQPIEMSAAQIQAYRSLPHLMQTNRPIQQANGRAVALIAGQ